MKKRAVIILAALAILGFLFFLPRPILKHVDDGFVHFVRYNPNFKTGEPEYSTIEIPEETKQKILECLGQYWEYRTLFFEQGYSLNNMELEIYINDGKESKNIVLGNVNYTTKSYGALKRGIYNADALRAELLDILGLPGPSKKEA